MSQGKVFGIGFHKTGTSTLDKALTILGYKVCGVQWDLGKELKKGRYGPAFEMVKDYDAFQDNPWPILFKELDERWPGSKFILTERDEEKWIRSIVNHLGENTNDMREWIYDGIGAPKGNEEHFLQRYRRHNREVREYFKGRPEDLLIVDWEKGDGWELICGFLGHEVPEEPFPHENPGTYSKRKKFLRRVRNHLKRLSGRSGR